MEERRLGTAVPLRDFDAHHAELEELVEERSRHACVLIHVADARPDLSIGELVNAVTKQLFVVGQRRKGGDRFRGWRHGGMLSSGKRGGFMVSSRIRAAFLLTATLFAASL